MKRINQSFENTLKKISVFVVMFFVFNGVYGQSIKELNGHFIGDAKIIVNWCNLDSLAFDISIDSLGNVTGKIGDAKIIQGKVKTNSFGSTKYIIEAELDGFIIEKEGIKRKSIKIPFDYVGKKLIGGFGTSGSKFGGKEKMILSGTDLVLIRQYRNNESQEYYRLDISLAFDYACLYVGILGNN